MDAVAALPVGMFDCLQSIQNTGNSTLVTPSSPTYDTQRLGYDRNFDFRPIAIYYPATNADAAAAIQCAAAFNIPVAPRSGGHSFEGYSVGGKDGALVIDLAYFQQFSLDPVTGVATVGGGTRLGPLYSRLWDAGQYLISSGLCPSVGIGGIALGGGIGFGARKYGMTTQNVVGMTMIDAEGDILKVSKSSNHDMFWALRGAGGGSFGLVTEFQIQAYKAPPNVVVFYLSYNWQRYREAIHSFASWGKTATDDLYISAHFNGQNINVLSSVFGIKEQAMEAMALFLEIMGEPRVKNISEGSWHQAAIFGAFNVSLEKPDLTVKRFHRGRSLVYRKPMSTKELDIINNYLHTTPMPKGANERYIGFELWGGKINRPNASPAVFDYHRGVNFSVQSGVIWDAPYGELGHECAECLQWSTDFAREMQRAYSSSTVLEAYQNYMERDLPDALHAYYGDNLPRLMTIKKRVDPKNVFSFPQSIPLP
ncbi:hypothetical protein BGW41_003145 [Actinomortierella wolfii]|nr:hypothetical protein BGW41_003145 [Actinomortierella wolfii]